MGCFNPNPVLLKEFYMQNQPMIKQMNTIELEASSNDFSSKKNLMKRILSLPRGLDNVRVNTKWKNKFKNISIEKVTLNTCQGDL